MAKRVPREKKPGMYEAILQLETLEECLDFFQDICAETELRSMEQRFEVAGMLKQNMVYSDIMQKTSASTATISRVNRMLNTGTGMLEKSLERLEESKSEQS
ncbi:MAG: TrpR-like protein [Blautia sp.]|nr:TrpR-like protein [Blautia sp.]